MQKVTLPFDIFSWLAFTILLEKLSTRKSLYLPRNALVPLMLSRYYYVFCAVDQKQAKMVGKYLLGIELR